VSPEHRMYAGRAVLIAGCLYEVYAAGTNRAPTITAIVKAAGARRRGRFVMWLWLGYVVDHFARP
jgi:hypothetical protein